MPAKYHGHNFEIFPSTMQIKQNTRLSESTLISSSDEVCFICSDAGSSSKSCQWCLACNTVCKELHVTTEIFLFWIIIPPFWVLGFIFKSVWTFFKRFVRTTKSKFHSVTCHEGPEEVEAQPYSLFNLCTRWGWMVNVTPQPLYPPVISRYPFYRRMDGPKRVFK